MKAYWMARAKVNDPVRYKRYTDQVPAIIAAHGGRILARGGQFVVLEGPPKFERFIIIEFPSLEAARTCHDSEAYQTASKWRKEDNVGEVELVIVEGMES